MTLSLATTVVPVTKLASGIIVVQCSEYPGPSRSSLSVVSHYNSINGDVVKEEQVIAPQTAYYSPSTLWASVDPTIAVPITDLPLDSGFSYEIFVSCKTDGNPPTNALARATQHTYSSDGASVSFALGDDLWGAWGWPPFIARKQVDNFTIYDTSFWQDAGADELQIRAWGVDGGDVSLYFDMIYIVPLFGGDLDTSTDGGELPLKFLSNGSKNPDDDSDSSSAPWLGSQSSLKWGMPFVASPGVTDLQADDDESSVPIFSAYASKSWLAYVAGTAHMEAHPLLEDDFSGVTPIAPFHTFGYWQHIISNYVATATDSFSGLYDLGFGVQRNSWFLEGDGLATCYIPEDQVEEIWAPLYYGGVERSQYEIDSGASTSDPSSSHPTFDMKSGIFQATFGADSIANWHAGVGVRRSAILDATDWHKIGAHIYVDNLGEVTLSLLHKSPDVTSGSTIYSMDGPVTAVASLGGAVVVKAERRGYFWRAKAWEDGDDEPEDWMVEGWEPLISQNTSGSVVRFRDHPYDTSYNDSDDDKVHYDPRGAPNSSSAYYPSFPSIWAGNAPGQARMKVLADDFSIEYDPGDGSLNASATKTTKLDGTLLDTGISIPYGSQRMIVGDDIVRSFGSDGFNIRAWKDIGFPEASPAIVGWVWQREILGGVVWLPMLYRRVL